MSLQQPLQYPGQPRRMETLLLEWKVERTMLIEWPGEQGIEVSQTRVMRMTNDDPEPRIFVNERGDAFVGMFPPTSATEKLTQKTEPKQASTQEKGSQMDIVPESQLDEHQEKSNGSSSSNGRGKYDAEEAEITLAETMELEAAVHQKADELEQEAEQRANKLFMKWCKEKKSLEQAINELMSDHLELHEKFHALRLQFEHEKRQFASKIMQDARSFVDSSTKGSSSSSMEQFDPNSEDGGEREGTKKQKGENGEAIEAREAHMNTKRKFVTPSKF